MIALELGACALIVAVWAWFVWRLFKGLDGEK